MSNTITINLHTEKMEWGYYAGDLLVTARPKVLSRAAHSIILREDSLGSAQVTCIGVRGGELTYLDFKKASTLDEICAKWLLERGLIDMAVWQYAMRGPTP